MFNRNKKEDEQPQQPAFEYPTFSASNSGGGGGNVALDHLLGGIQQQADRQASHVQGQINNYKQRLSVAGYDPEDVADGRNMVEKFLNLPDKQFWMFDILELVNRPVKSLMGGLEEATMKRDTANLTQSQVDNMTGDEIDAYNANRRDGGQATGEDILKGLKEGFTGENRDYSGGQVVRNMFSDGKEKDGFGWEDVAGMGLEMVLDPVRLALFVSSGGTSEIAGAGAEAAQVAKGITDAAKGIDKADKALDVAKVATDTAKLAQKGAKGAEALQDGAAAVEMMSQGILMEKQLSKVPEALQSIGRLVKGEQVTGRLAKIRDAETMLGKAGRTIGGVAEVATKVTDPNFWLFSQAHNATHVSALGKAMQMTTSGASRLAKAGIDMGTNRYMQSVSNLMESNPELALQKAEQYLDLDESVKRMLNKTPKFIKQTQNRSQAELELVNVETTRVHSEFIYSSEAAFEKVQGLEYIDDVTGEALKYFESPKEMNKILYDLREAQGKTIEKSLGKFVHDMSFRTGVGRTLPGDPQTLAMLNDLLGGSDLAEFGIKKIAGVGSDVGSLVFDENIWNSSNVGNLVNSITKVNPEAALEGIQLGKEISPKAQMILEELTKSEALSPVKELLGTYNESIEKIQAMTGEAFFSDPETIKKLTKAHFGEGYAPHSISEEGRELNDFLRKINKTGLADADVTGMTGSEALYTQAKQNLGDAQQAGQAGLSGKSVRGDSRLLNSRNMEGTAYQNNQVMKNYLTHKYADAEVFAKNFPNATEGMHDELIDMIKNTEWFERSANQSLLDLGFSRAESASKVSIRTELALGETFGGAAGNYEGIQVIGKNQRVPVGLEKVSIDDVKAIKRNIESAQMYTQSPAVDALVNRLDEAMRGSSSVYMDEAIKGYVTQTSKLPTDVFLDNLNNATNTWKRLKVSSPAYQMRNVTGNLYNANASGISISDSLAGVEDSRLKLKELGTMDLEGSIMNRYSKGAKLSPRETEIFDMYKDMRRAGFLDDGYVYEMEGIRRPSYQGPEADKTALKAVTDKISDVNMQMNQSVDDWFRLSTYQHAKGNPEYMAKLGVKSPIEAVKLVHFDATDLTYIEDRIIKKIVPFYNFNRQNLKYQMSNIAKNPDRFRMFNKGFEQLWNMAGVDLQDMPEWQRENYELPIPGMGNKGDGQFTSLKANLPVGDIIDYTSNPLKAFMSSINPAIRAPFEMIAGKQMFSGQDIDLKSAEGLAKYTAETIGIDVPLRLPIGVYQAMKGDPVKGLETFMASTRSNDTSKKATSDEYDELDRLKEYFDKLKKQGIEIPTITELRRQKIIK